MLSADDATRALKLIVAAASIRSYTVVIFVRMHSGPCSGYCTYKGASSCRYT